jgi:hypothetical protein
VLPEPPQQAVHKTEATGADAQSIFMGNLAMVNLLDAIQMIENSRMTGALMLTLPGLKGEIQFNSGLIAGARTGDEAGAGALTKFIDVHDGTFEFIKSDEPYNPTIQTRSNLGLLTDMMRVKDQETVAPSHD